MRSRGAGVADIAVLVVSASDGVMPQTIESIEHIRNASIPFVVALNKIDLPEANPEKIKGELVKQDVLLEGYGGDVPIVPLSAKKGTGIKDLLEIISLFWEMKEHKEDTKQFTGTIIESNLDKNKGPVATIIIRTGKLEIGDVLETEEVSGKIKAMLSDQRISVKEALPGDPVEILGFSSVPKIGSRVWKKGEMVIVQEEKKEIEPLPPTEIEVAPTSAVVEKRLKVIIKADAYGSLEAILGTVKQNDLEILLSAVGNITESDILLAKTAGAFVIGFNMKPSTQVTKLAESEKVLIKTYNIIYEMLDELEDVVKALREGGIDKILGEAQIMARFDMKDGVIAGVKIVSGKISRGDQIKVLRGKVEVGRAKIKSLRHAKDNISHAEPGTEAGLILSNKLDFSVGDSIISIG
ncbi:MAG: Translation initiation factor IF-2 [Candidatus Gottesmanbacteria bacterium GW2011_GWC2_39_8]|nr:MAG: Translation initiation factor IF-2 [Candidatus Gottesmanbacteria bacterium GW2011_GWC2_39_8]